MTITLDLQKSKGITLNLTKDLPSLKKLTARLGWEPHPVTGKSLTAGFDLDIAVFALNANGKLDGGNDVVFFNNPKYTNDSIVLPADNRDGSDHPEEIHFTLPDVPANRHQLDIYVTIFEAATRKQNFGMVANAFVELVDTETGKQIQAYALNENFSQDTAVHLGSLVRDGSGGWAFNPVGVGASADLNAIAGAYL